MTAVLIPTASDAEWHAARRQGITASEIAVVLGLSPYSSPYKLYHQKLGILPADEQEDEMEFGAFCEPYIARKFAERHPDLYAKGDGRELWRHVDRPWQMATPDRLIYDWRLDPTLVHPLTHGRILAVLECKIDNGDEWGDEGTDEIPVHYRCQVLWQMDVMGVSRAYVACLGRDRKVREYVVEHAPEHESCAESREGCKVCEDQALMRAAARDFLDRIDTKDEPDTDWHPATRSALNALYPGEDGGDVMVRPSLAISYTAAVRRYKDAERRKDEMTAAVLEVLRNDRRAIDPRTGDPIATRSVSRPKRIDVERLRAEQPAIAAEYTKPPKPEVKLTPAKPKTKKES